MRLTLGLNFMIVIGVATSLVAYADTSKDHCADIRLDTSGGSMEHVPVFSQGGTPTCYIHAATEMADAWRFSHGPQPPAGGYSSITSPAILARDFLGYIYRNPPPSIFTDQVETLGNYLRDHGGCSHRHVFGDGPESFSMDRRMLVERVLVDYFNAQVASRDGNQQIRDDILLDISLHHSDWSPFARLAALETSQAYHSSQTVLACRNLLAVGFNSDTLAESLGSDAALALAGFMGRGPTSPSQFIHIFEQEVCRAHRLELSWIPPFHSRRTANPSMILSRLHDRLGAGAAQPIGVSFCAGLLTDPNYRGLTFVGNDCSRNDEHAALVIGQRWNPASRTCQFLIRNSWGPGCERYRAHHPHWDCEEGKGQLWMDEEALAANAFFLNWIGD